VGGYLVLRRIGSGGMADVYLAEQKSLGRQVALKVLHGTLAHDSSYVERFHNEARAAAALVHPNIVQIYEVGQADGVHFIAQEFVAGKSLEQILESQGALDQGLVLEILRQVVSALCKSAEVGIVHRDIKPANILLSPSGTVRVADFGLARVLSSDTKTLTQVGVAMGTPLYMSPEQIEGRPVDIRSDIYSLGVTSYHLLAGEPPHRGDTPLAIAVQHLHKQPQSLGSVRVGLTEKFVQLVHRMMAKQPADRYETPAGLLSDLKDLSSDAARQGWAAGPEQWSLVEWIAAKDSVSDVSAELRTVLLEQAQLDPPKTGWRSWATLLLIALVFGGLLGLLIQPRFLLRSSSSMMIPVRKSPEAQLFHAKMVDSEAAWRAVWENFPGVDAFYKQLAQQGLVRHFLFVSQEYGKTLPLLRELGQQATSNESVRAFVLAAESVSHEQLGHRREAAEAYSQLTPADKDILSRNEPQLFELLQSSLSQL
jgi:eukaryotic-like serine/threonine-protein kinase